MKQKFNAGADLDLLTKGEVEELLKASQTSWFNEVAKGDRYRRFGVQSTVIADTTVTFGDDPHNQVGPNDGFIWAVKRLNIIGGEIDPGTNDTFIYLNSASPSNMVRQLVANYTAFGNNELVMYPGDQLIVTSTGLTDGTIVTLTGAVRELPLPMGWRLD
jgi:hypothetical protein